VVSPPAIPAAPGDAFTIAFYRYKSRKKNSHPVANGRGVVAIGYRGGGRLFSLGGVLSLAFPNFAAVGKFYFSFDNRRCPLAYSSSTN